jgi:hypothetical protein
MHLAPFIVQVSRLMRSADLYGLIVRFKMFFISLTLRSIPITSEEDNSEEFIPWDIPYIICNMLSEKTLSGHSQIGSMVISD